jgi:hypothetical protein
MSSTYKAVTRPKTNPAIQAVPTPEEPIHAADVEREAIEQLVSRTVASAMASAVAELRRPMPAPSPEAGLPSVSLWSLIPKRWRPLLLVAAALVLGSPSAVIAYGERFAGLPEEVDGLRASVVALQKAQEAAQAQTNADLDEIKRLLRAETPRLFLAAPGSATSAPTR